MLTWVALKSTWDDIGTALVALALRIDGTISTLHISLAPILDAKIAWFCPYYYKKREIAAATSSSY